MTRWAVIRSSYPELRDTTIRTFQEWIPDKLLQISKQPPYKGSTWLKLEDGTILNMEVIFMALDDEDTVSKLKSLDLTGAWINEAVEVPKAILDHARARVDRFPSPRMGGTTWNGVIMDTNPCDDEHWWYKLAEQVQPEGYKFWKQPPAVIRVPPKEGEAFPTYVPNQGQIPGIMPCENVGGHNKGYGYWMNLVAGSTEEYIKVYLMGEYGTIVAGKPVMGEYNDSLHCAKSELSLYNGLPLLLSWDFGLCYSDDTEVLTETGWKFFKDVDEATDRVATRNPDNGSMEFTDINFKVDKPYKGKMLEWKSQNVNFCVTPEHRVPFTHRDTPDKVHWTSAQWLADHPGGHYYVDVMSDWNAPDDDGEYFGMTADNFAEFMGIYLSEGCASKKTNNITIYQMDEPGIFCRILSETPYRWYRGDECWRISDADLAKYLRRFGTSGTKYVPQQIKNMSSRQIKLFINAYTAGDGHIRTRTNGSVEHTLFTISERMAGDMQELAQKAGWNSSLRCVKPQQSTIIEDGAPRVISNQGGYSITFKKKTKRAELLKRNFSEIDYDGRVYCLNVPHHILYVRRGGRPSWNGNTPACVFSQVSPRGQFRVIEELCCEDGGIRSFARDVVIPHLKANYSAFKIQSVGDPAGGTRAESDETTCFNELEHLGIPTEPAAPTNNFIARREALAGYLTKLVDGEPGFLIDPTKAPMVRKGLMGHYRFRKMRLSTGERYTDKPEKNKYSHPCEALQYGTLAAQGPINMQAVRLGNAPTRSAAKKVVVKSSRGWT